MDKYIKNLIEMLGRFVIFSIVLFVLVQMEVSTLAKVLSMIILTAWLFIPVIELVKIKLKGDKK